MPVEFVTLTETEKQERAQSLAQKLDEIEHLELKKKISAKEFGQKIDNLKSDVRDLTQAVRTGEERRVRHLWDNEIHDTED